MIHRLDRRSARFAASFAVALITGLLAVPAPAAPPAAGSGETTASAESVDDLIARGRAAAEAGDWDVAREALDRAAEQRPDDPLLAFDRGVAAYWAGDRAAAAEHFRRTLSTSTDSELRAAASYNLGTMAYQRAGEALPEPGEADPGTIPPVDPGVLDAADADLTEALERFRAALGEDPGFDRARVNAELAQRRRQRLQAIREQLPPPQQQSQPQSGDGEPSEDQQAGGEQSGQSSGESQGEPSGESQGEPSAEDRGEQGEAGSGGEASTSGETGESGSDPSGSGDDRSSPESSEAGDPGDPGDSGDIGDPGAPDEPTEPVTPPSPGDDPSSSPDAAPSPQDPAAPDERPEPSETPGDPAADGDAGERRSGSSTLSREEAERLLQLVRDRERARQEARAEAAARRRRVTERDW